MRQAVQHRLLLRRNLRRETEKAFLFFDGTKEVWLAKSLVEWDESEETMTMPAWVALDKGLL